jgi:hypothetical protein
MGCLHPDLSAVREANSLQETPSHVSSHSWYHSTLHACFINPLLAFGWVLKKNFFVIA